MSGVAEVSPETWLKLGKFVASHLGLDYPPKRLPDLRRAFAPAMREFGYDDPAACIHWLLAQPPAATLQVLANHLTIGETYFFRDRPALDALAMQVLPALIHARRDQRRQLRLWCAACSTGEEAYTLAIILHKLLPDLDDWDVSIRATDVNSRFLDKARAGNYGEWSFRNAPDWLKPRYFKRNSDGSYAVLPAIRRLVKFDTLNLAAPDPWPASGGASAVDAVFCRNMLMYFSEEHSARVVNRMWHALGEQGWLVVAPGEVTRSAAAGFQTVTHQGAILFRKMAASSPSSMLAGEAARIVAPTCAMPFSESFAGLPPATQNRARDPAKEAGSPERLTQVRTPGFSAAPLPETRTLLQRARSLANQGLLDDALACCDSWLCQDRMDPAAHYLRAVVLLEQGDRASAQDALRRSIYLDGGFVMAHFALGRIARDSGRHEAAGKHFANALSLLRDYQADALLPHSDELSAGHLSGLLKTLTAAPEGVS